MSDLVTPTKLHPRRFTMVCGTPTAYRDGGCRCDACTAAALRSAAEYRVWRRANPDGSRKIPTHGTRRRLLALAYIGYTQRTMAEAIGTTQCTIYRILTGRVSFVYETTEQAVKDVFDRLGAQPPPPADHHAQRAMRWARTQPEAAPPMAWDDEDLDDPDGRPFTDDEDDVDEPAADDPHAAFIEDVQWLWEGGESLDMIAQRYHVQPDAIRARLQRNGGAWLWDKIRGHTPEAEPEKETAA